MATKVAWVVDMGKDNVATILGKEVTTGKVIPVTIKEGELQIKVNSSIPYGHKVAIRPIKKGETVFKYGLSIGRATVDIAVGDHVHLHNTESNRGRGDLAIAGKGEVAVV